MSTRSDEEIDDPHYADRRNFYEVEKWSRVELMPYAGNNLDKARRIFERMVKHRPCSKLTIRQRTRVLDQHPSPVARDVVLTAARVRRSHWRP